MQSIQHDIADLVRNLSLGGNKNQSLFAVLLLSAEGRRLAEVLTTKAKRFSQRNQQPPAGTRLSRYVE